MCVQKRFSLLLHILLLLTHEGKHKSAEIEGGEKIWKGKGRDVECGPFFNGEDLTCHIGSFVGKVMLKNIIYKAIIFSF